MKKETSQTQDLMVLSVIKRQGFISRNYCLDIHISRLGAIICRLTGQGKIQVKDRGYTEDGDYEYIAKVTTKKNATK